MPDTARATLASRAASAAGIWTTPTRTRRLAVRLRVSADGVSSFGITTWALVLDWFERERQIVPTRGGRATPGHLARNGVEALAVGGTATYSGGVVRGKTAGVRGGRALA